MQAQARAFIECRHPDLVLQPFLARHARALPRAHALGEVIDFNCKLPALRQGYDRNQLGRPVASCNRQALPFIGKCVFNPGCGLGAIAAKVPAFMRGITRRTGCDGTGREF
ncbi:hypothetical protein LV478_12375 [Komagataeibacter oboediens]|uniref:Methyltransferase n=1 Tax=Komagataeibacter oboediens TaxID=65958 RepID=A0ABS5SLU6_9PROT|nr:hypothetical protein [Komagataeibacter oboediens]MBT0675154.1 hypothetical protein [Komagataeibacter oboediens]MBT0678765.1 hypothetical protein [Komagataeibacter oboediens]WEQ51325.1 hypothetical protein LV478_12375 [Komagataeibacter oboediens]